MEMNDRDLAPSAADSPDFFDVTEDPCGENPFPASDSRHESWKKATRRAQEELAKITELVHEAYHRRLENEWNRVKAELLQYGRPLAEISMAPLLVPYYRFKFDTWAWRNLAAIIEDADLSIYDRWLKKFASDWLVSIEQSGQPVESKAILIRELRSSLQAGIPHWQAEARRHLRQQSGGEISAAEPPSQPEFNQKKEGPESTDSTAADRFEPNDNRPEASEDEFVASADGMEDLAAWVPTRRPDWRDDAQAVRECPVFLTRAKARRLAAIARLRTDAAEVLRRTMPQQPENVEHCLWPLFAVYATQVFDKMAEAELSSIKREAIDTYGVWLRSECLPEVVSDTCTPFLSQFQATLRYVVERIGEVDRPPDLVRMRQVLWQMIAEAVVPDRQSPYTRLVKHLEGTLLEERVPYWEAKAIEIAPESPSPGPLNCAASLPSQGGAAPSDYRADSDTPSHNPGSMAPTDDSGGALLAQNRQPIGTVDVVAERRALLAAYKDECKRHGVKVTDAMIAKAASPTWNDRTAIQKWRGCDPRYDGAPDRLIRGVFASKPHLQIKPKK